MVCFDDTISSRIDLISPTIRVSPCVGGGGGGRLPPRGPKSRGPESRQEEGVGRFRRVAAWARRPLRRAGRGGAGPIGIAGAVGTAAKTGFGDLLSLSRELSADVLLQLFKSRVEQLGAALQGRLWMPPELQAQMVDAVTLTTERLRGLIHRLQGAWAVFAALPLAPETCSANAPLPVALDA